VKTTISVFFWVCFTTSVHAEPTVSAWFSSELGAVIAAADRYNPISINQDREFIGAVLKLDHCYTYTVTAGKRGADQVSARIRVPVGAEIVAFWHTHGVARHSNRYFSAIDAGLVRHQNKPFYLADYTGRLKVLKPGAARLSFSQARRLGLPARSGFAAGRGVKTAGGEAVRVARR